ncbi:MAG: winged helix-turn-helix domain-containing protein [Armatimonadota bacterium]|nr:winged helix-turn-helix domain-containing protein [Armatimonadota bacterium]MDR7452187.1 winged helix-turn-helix domain-containing protein [Armatimonadota bacterium]MDR7468046.1 winged helix-turn-helix domain-containing protein [Armatimonadota bacterium]MDR7494913.1 winged helix-turn-helix domain-containing protein [Armatimonadota bacterium]MDR7500363.1 winged helix-turn-helix domain-containing protein [Armatimonadota bacterium]
MKVIDLTSKSPGLVVRVDPSPVYDFLAALFVAENWDPERGFEIDRGWVQRARGALDAALRRDLRLFARERGFMIGLTSFLAGRTGATIPEFLRLVAAASPREVVERMLTAPRAARPAAPLLREVLRTRRDSAVRELLAAYPKEYEAGRVREIVTSPPGEVQQRLLRLLRGFYGGVYAGEEARVIPLLRADAERQTALALQLPPAEFIERATGGITVAPDAEIAQVVLAPSYFFRPYNLISEYPGARLFIYPVDLTRGEEVSPVQELARLCKALGDETRLRILQMLAEREMYLQEIANRLGVSHVTAIHHLAQLRAAHLVRSVERGGLKFFQLRPDTAVRIGRQVRELVAGRQAGASDEVGGR